MYPIDRTGSFACCLVLLFVVGCDGGSDPVVPEADDTIVAVLLSPESSQMSDLGQTVEFEVSARNADGRIVTNRVGDFSWSSSDPEVVSVTSTGVATAQGEGAATITAGIEGRSASAGVTVDLSVSTVELMPVADTLTTLGQTRQLEAVAYNALGGLVTDDPEAFEWSSSDPDVASVDGAGVVTASGVGTASVTALIEGESATATIVVDLPVPGEFRDRWLEEAVREALDRPTGDLTAEDLEALVELEAIQAGIEDLSGLEFAVNLEELRLRQNDVRNLAPLGSLLKLRELDLAVNQVDDLTPLAGLEALEDLNIGGQLITTGREVLVELPRLRRLVMVGAGLTDLSFLSGAPTLEILNVSANLDLTDISAVAGSSELIFLFMSNTGASDISVVADLVSLQVIQAHNSPVEDLTPLAGLTNLTSVSLQGIATSDLSPLSGLTQLESVRASQMGLTDLDWAEGLVNLESLMVIENDLSDLSPLRSLENLRSILLAINQIEDLGPLVANEHIGSGALIQLVQNPLSQTALCQQIPTLQDRGASVFFDGEC